MMLSSDDAWNGKFSPVSNYSDDDVDESRIPQCAESVITMLLTLTDR